MFRRGLRLDGPLFLLLAASNGLRHDRLGLAVGRRLGSAVLRSRAKRLLRESFRRRKRAAGPALDLVLVPKRALLEARGREVEREYERRLDRLAARLDRGASAPVER